MKNHPILVVLVMIMLFAAGITGLYRGARQLNLEQPQTPKPVEQPQDAPTVTQTPAPKLPPAPSPQPPIRPHSAEHAVALNVAQALNQPPAEKQASLDELIRTEQLPKESAEILQQWNSERGKVKTQEIGTIIPTTGGGKLTRYRLSAEGCNDDLLLTIVTPEQGKPRVQSVELVSADKVQLNTQSDALSVVEGFLEALKRGDMDTARRLVSGGDVSDATLAGLCMMFEEGDLVLRERIPMRNMYHNDKNAGYLVYLSPKEGSGAAGNVGIELVRNDENGWRVKAVALDQLLNHYEKVAEAEGGVYFPLVKNPHGGDSLVLYFGFDDATLSPRSASQLRIVAQLLVNSGGSLNISGHTDDIGTEEYNMDLSLRRADTVKKVLLSYGVQAERITTKGLGKSQPRRTYQAGDSRQMISTIRRENRRAEIYLDF